MTFSIIIRDDDRREIGAAIASRYPAVGRSVLSAPGAPIAERLISALAAGEGAGGDRRGRQAAALRVHRSWTSHPIDLRVDDHDWPVQELDRMYRSLVHDGVLDAFDATIPVETEPQPRHPEIVF